MAIQDFNQNILANVCSFLDKYDANNLRMVNKFFKEDVDAIEKIKPFNKPIYRQNKDGFSKILTKTFSYKSFGPQENLTWAEDRTARNNSCRYIIYMIDDFGGFPHFFKDKSEVSSIMNSYYTFREGYKNQKEFLEKKLKEKPIYKKNTFLYKVKNPWKKV